MRRRTKQRKPIVCALRRRSDIPCDKRIEVAHFIEDPAAAQVVRRAQEDKTGGKKAG